MIQKKIWINTLIRFEEHRALMDEVHQFDGFDENTMTIVYNETDLDICQIINSLPSKYHYKVKLTDC